MLFLRMCGVQQLWSGDGRDRFGRLSRIAKLILVIPHSNASEERVFSVVKKNKTPFRLSLDYTSLSWHWDSHVISLSLILL